MNGSKGSCTWRLHVYDTAGAQGALTPLFLNNRTAGPTPSNMTTRNSRTVQSRPLAWKPRASPVCPCPRRPRRARRAGCLQCVPLRDAQCLAREPTLVRNWPRTVYLSHARSRHIRAGGVHVSPALCGRGDGHFRVFVSQHRDRRGTVAVELIRMCVHSSGHVRCDGLQWQLWGHSVRTMKMARPTALLHLPPRRRGSRAVSGWAGGRALHRTGGPLCATGSTDCAISQPLECGAFGAHFFGGVQNGSSGFFIDCHQTMILLERWCNHIPSPPLRPRPHRPCKSAGVVGSPQVQSHPRIPQAKAPSLSLV